MSLRTSLADQARRTGRITPAQPSRATGTARPAAPRRANCRGQAACDQRAHASAAATATEMIAPTSNSLAPLPAASILAWRTSPRAALPVVSARAYSRAARGTAGPEVAMKLVRLAILPLLALVVPALAIADDAATCPLPGDVAPG